MRQKSVVVALLVFLLLTGCGSGPTGSGGNAVPDRGGREPAPAPAHAGTGKEFSAAERARMDVAWKAFLEDSPIWPEYREDWVAMGPLAVNVLVDNLVNALWRGHLAGFPEVALKARNELVLLDQKGVPTVAGVLAQPYYLDPGDGKRRRLPNEIVNNLTEVLLLTGATPELSRLADSDTPSVRLAALDALGRLPDPRGLTILVRTLETHSDWTARMAAAKALRFRPEGEANRALISALARDPDQAVVITTAESLARRGALEAIPALNARRERARAEGDHKIAAYTGRAVQLLEETR